MTRYVPMTVHEPAPTTTPLRLPHARPAVTRARDAELAAASPVLHPAHPLARDRRACRCGHPAGAHVHHSESEHCTRCGKDLCRAFRPRRDTGRPAVRLLLTVLAVMCGSPLIWMGALFLAQWVGITLALVAVLTLGAVGAVVVWRAER